ncbi:hypothetical protein [Microbacterium invictum]|uniref:Transcriptional regulator, AbiEi antitoxin, Type IV TA system n=1 Tax=Microbacterium invictum TaxID=515415 RepID=A0AA40VN83_9MICO|nr:hypothetical protein [Microbacterium invictum]MBB4140118.1 hypothetical protein [Microbacterium invictum]
MLERRERPSRARPVPETFRRTRSIPDETIATVRPGVRVWAREWDELYSEGRIRTLVHAVFARMSNATAVASHATAAAMHRLPLYRVRSDRIDVICPGANTRHDAADVVRHHVPVADGDLEIIDGIRVTTLDRTVYDAIRAVSLEAAVVIFDAALRAVAWDDTKHALDVDAAEEFRARVTRRIDAHIGARGIRQARFVTEIADGRAQLPGESVARLWMLLLGAPTPELQYRVDNGSGRIALLDFALPHLGRWLEFDGNAKYEDPYLLGERKAEDVKADQDDRERWVRRVTGWRPDRFGFAEMPDIEAFAQYLRSISLLP